MDYNSFIEKHQKGLDWNNIRALLNEYIKNEKTRLYDLTQTVINNNTSSVIYLGSLEDQNSFLLNKYKEYVDFLLNRINFSTVDDSIKSDTDYLVGKFFHDFLMIREDSKLQNPTDIEEVFENPKYRELQYQPVYKQQNDPSNRFTFINYDLVGLINQDDIGKIETRIYLSPSTEHILELVKKIIEGQRKEQVNCLMKVCLKEEYNDRIILYVPKKNFETYMHIVKKAIENHPEYFDEHTQNPLWGSLAGYDNIYYGENPLDSQMSYGTSRTKAIKETLLSILNGDLLINRDLTDEEFERFKKAFPLFCLKNNINPDNIAANYSDNLHLELTEDNNESKIYIKEVDVESERFVIGIRSVSDNSDYEYTPNVFFKVLQQKSQLS